MNTDLLDNHLEIKSTRTLNSRNGDEELFWFKEYNCLD